MFEIITAVAIPFIVSALKKLKLPSRLAPVTALVLAVLAVSVAKWLGINAEVETVYQLILQSIGIAGASVLGYDALKSVTK